MLYCREPVRKGRHIKDRCSIVKTFARTSKNAIGVCKTVSANLKQNHIQLCFKRAIQRTISYNRI